MRPQDTECVLHEAAGVPFGQIPNLGTAFDPTQESQEKAIPRSWTERIAQVVPVAISFLDRDLVFRWMNPAAMRLAATSAQLDSRSVLGASLRDLAQRAEAWQIAEPAGPSQPELPGAPEAEKAWQAAERALQTGQTREITVPYVLPDGTLTHWKLLFSPVPDARGNPEGVLLVAQDVTLEIERERMQQERIASLQALDRMKNDFLNASSHEIRTPLTSILGFAEFLIDETHGPLNPDQRSHVEQILIASHRLERIVGDLLDFARIEAGTFALVRREVDFRALVEEALESMRPQTLEAGVELWLEYEEEPLALECDPQRVTQVIQNLISNALKFSPPGKQVVVRIMRVGTRVRTEVRDSGPGIAAEDLPRIFDRFFQGRTAPQQAHRGAGLGLFVSRVLVEAHGGQIGVQSKVGAGSTFWFELPLEG